MGGLGETMDKAFPNHKWDALASFYYPDDILGIGVQINGEWHGEKCDLASLPEAIARLRLKHKIL